MKNVILEWLENEQDIGGLCNFEANIWNKEMVEKCGNREGKREIDRDTQKVQLTS